MKAIVAQNLSKHFKTHSRSAGLKAAFQSFFKRNYTLFKAVDQVSFQVDEGEILGVLGANGAGKTTLLKCLIGLLTPTPQQGSSLQVLGYAPSKRPTDFLRQVAIVLGQKNQLWWDLPAADSFELHRHIYRIEKKEFKRRLEELTTLLDVGSKLGTQVRRLSLGERMKMEIIAALLHYPRLVLLDEPTIGLDLSAQRSMRNFIKQYNKSHKTTFLITSHYMRDIEELCPRVLFVHQGKLLFDGSLARLASVVPQDDQITATIGERVGRLTDEQIQTHLAEKMHGRLEIKNEQLTCNVFHSHIGRALNFLSNNYVLEDIQVSSVSVEQTVSAIYNDPDKLQRLQQLQ